MFEGLVGAVGPCFSGSVSLAFDSNCEASEVRTRIVHPFTGGDGRYGRGVTGLEVPGSSAGLEPDGGGGGGGEGGGLFRFGAISLNPHPHLLSRRLGTPTNQGANS